MRTLSVLLLLATKSVQGSLFFLPTWTCRQTVSEKLWDF